MDFQDTEERKTMPDIIVELSLEFDEATMARHRMGAEKYGPGKFLTVDTLQEALDEVVDLANYARYTYIRLRLLQEAIMLALPDGADTPADSPFLKAKDVTAVNQE
jgi:hypothetical protein